LRNIYKSLNFYHYVLFIVNYLNRDWLAVYRGKSFRLN
jgi:hypothetical protein